MRSCSFALSSLKVSIRGRCGTLPWRKLVRDASRRATNARAFSPIALRRAPSAASSIAAAIAETGATSVKEMGKVMSALMPQVQGRADGKLVSEMVREALRKG